MSNSIYRQFWRYTIPTVAAMLVNGLYQVVDGIFIGQYIGANGLAGINVAWPVIGTILGIGLMIGVGTGALTSIEQGKGNPLAAKKVLVTGLLMLIIITPIVAVVLWTFSADFLRWQGADGEVFTLGMQYLEVLIFACAFSLGSIALPFLLRNDNSPQLATWLMVLGAVINIVLDYIFIVIFNWQLVGAALASAIAQAIVTLLGVLYFFSSRAQLRLTRRCFSIQWHLIGKICAIGVSSFFMYAYGAVMIAMHNALFAHYGSTILVGSYAILGYIVTVYYLTAEGVANGMQPLVSFNYGAKSVENIKKLLNIAMITAVLSGIAFVLLLNLFPYQSVSVFNGHDNELVEGAVTGIRLHLFALYLDGFLVVAAAFYQAINKGSKALFVTLGNLVVQLPFLYILPKMYGVTGVWIAYPCSNIVLAIVVIWMIVKDVKQLDEQVRLSA